MQHAQRAEFALLRYGAVPQYRDEQRHQREQNEGGREGTQSQRGRCIDRRREHRHVALVRLQPQGLACLCIHARFYAGKCAPGLERIEAEMGSAVRVLVALVVPLVADRMFYRAALLFGLVAPIDCREQHRDEEQRQRQAQAPQPTVPEQCQRFLARDRGHHRAIASGVPRACAR